MTLLPFLPELYLDLTFIFGGMSADIPPFRCFMYLNYYEISILKEKIHSDTAVLRNLRERLNRQIYKLSANTQTEKILLQMNKSVQRLDEQIDLLITFGLIIDRVKEEYTLGEEKITDRVENCIVPGKAVLVPFQSAGNIDLFTRLLR